MGNKPRIGDEDGGDVEQTPPVIPSSDTSGIDAFTSSVPITQVDPKFEESKNAFFNRLRPMVMESLPVSINSFMQKYNQYMNKFAATITDDTSRRETAVMMAREQVPVDDNTIDEAEACFGKALQQGANQFRETLNQKAQQTIGQAGSRSEQIKIRLKTISEEVSRLHQESQTLNNEFAQLESTAKNVQSDLRFKESAFGAAYAAVETEGEQLLAELRKMVA